jgi:hypothetical protein
MVPATAASSSAAASPHSSLPPWPLPLSRYKGKFEFTYVSKSAVIVKTLQTGMRIVLKSLYGYEIEKLNIYQDRFLVARTPTTLLMGDLDTCKLSEVPWASVGAEKFHFENDKVGCALAKNGGGLAKWAALVMQKGATG